MSNRRDPRRMTPEAPAHRRNTPIGPIQRANRGERTTLDAKRGEPDSKYIAWVSPKVKAKAKRRARTKAA